MDTSSSTTAQVKPQQTLDIDIEREPAEMQRAGQQQQPPPRAQIVRELPKQQSTAASDTVSILRYSEEHLGELFSALSAAQGQFGQIERTLKADIKSKRTGAEFSYEYAPLDEVLQAVRPALAENGLSFQQFPAVGNGFVVVRSLLGHKSGGWMMNDLRLACDTGGPQEAGSGITFARRYAAMPMLGVAPGNDDDGSAAQPKGEPPRAGQRRSAQPAQEQEQEQKAAPARPAAAAAKPPAGRAAKPAPSGAGATPAASAGKPSASPAAPPAASQPASASAPVSVPVASASDVTAIPAQVGKIAELLDRPNGCIVVLDTGFRAASKDVESTRALKVHRQVGATIKLTTRESSDPSRFAPVISAIDIVKAVVKDREPGEEG